MKKAFYLLLLLPLLLQGCAAHRYRVAARQSITKIKELDKRGDSLFKAYDASVKKGNDRFELHFQKDSVAMTGGGSAELELSPVELKPVTNASGKKTSRTFRADNGSMHATVTIGADGKARIDCKMDSVLRVVSRMYKDSVEASSFLDSCMSSLVVADHSEIKDMDSTSMQMVVKAETKGFMAQVRDGLLYVFALFGLIVAARFAVKYVIKYIKYRTLPWS